VSGIEWTDALRSRFWSYVERRGPDECWPWKGGFFSTGYGQFRAGVRKVRAHRTALQLERGELAPGMIACHRCDNKPCCNPPHLFAGTHADNAHDRDAKGRARLGRRISLPGALNPSAKLTEPDVRQIRMLAGQGLFQREIATRFGISQSQVGNIVRGASWV